MRRLVLIVVLLSSILALTACGSPTSKPTGSSRSPAGASLSVLELGSTYGTLDSLDPLTDTTPGINHDFLNAVYGELFEPGRAGTITPGLASGYTVTHGGREVDIPLRPKLTFSDGTALDAAAVVFNLKRDFDPGAAGQCRANFAAVSSVSALDATHVALHLSRPNPAIIETFIDEAPTGSYRRRPCTGWARSVSLSNRSGPARSPSFRTGSTSRCR
jgi:peptide/nickel transport system substrate-binding protein